MNSSSKLKCLLPVICSLLPHITMRRTGVIILNFKRFIVFHKLTRSDKIRTKNKDLSKFLWSLWKELTLGWSKRGWNYPEEGFSIPCISNHNPFTRLSYSMQERSPRSHWKRKILLIWLYRLVAGRCWWWSGLGSSSVSRTSRRNVGHWSIKRAKIPY